MTTTVASLSMAGLLAITALLSGCSPSVTLAVSANSANAASFYAEISPTAETLVRRFAGEGTEIFDKAEITKSITKAGLSIDKIEFPKKTGISVALTVPNLNTVLGSAIAVSSTGKRLSFTLSRESLAKAIALMPASTGDYLELLMAPAFTGENLTAAEYESTIAAAYGKTVGAELMTSKLTVKVQCPAPAREARIDTPATSAKAGSEATFTIPLSALLAMEKPIAAQVTW
jgi:hypothetical protein